MTEIDRQYPKNGQQPNEMVKKIKDNKPMRKRKFRKPRSRWMDE